jgi:septal ring factor EnvC (AmiA/AmiB activator)
MEIVPLAPFVSSRCRRLAWRAGVAGAIAATALLAQGVSAADKARAASAPPSKVPVLTQAQLRECMSQKESLRQRSESLVKTKADLDAAKAEIARTGAEITEAQATLDRTKKEAVDDFNAKIVARNALVDDYQTKGAAYNKDVEDVQATQDSYASACSNRRYDDRDLTDIQKKK